MSLLGRESSVTFVLGAARSGKSRRGEALVTQLATKAGREAGRCYLATAESFDDEMRQRIEQHRQDRGASWRTVECPLELPDSLRAALADHRTSAILIDCLTVWLGNLMHHQRTIEPAVGELLDALCGANVPIVVVSNEVGAGIVAESALGRRFRDEQGRLNQRVAALADRVELVVAGLPLSVK